MRRCSGSQTNQGEIQDDCCHVTSALGILRSEDHVITPRPKTASQKASKEKRDRDSCHKKQKNDILHFSTQPSNTSSNIITVGPDLVPQEETSL